MSLSVPRGRKPRKARATSALVSSNPSSSPMREAFPLHAFALGARSSQSFAGHLTGGTVSRHRRHSATGAPFGASHDGASPRCSPTEHAS